MIIMVTVIVMVMAMVRVVMVVMVRVMVLVENAAKLACVNRFRGISLGLLEL
jgi:hypothetical protein